MGKRKEQHTPALSAGFLISVLEPLRSMGEVAEMLSCSRSTIQITERRALRKILHGMIAATEPAPDQAVVRSGPGEAEGDWRAEITVAV